MIIKKITLLIAFIAITWNSFGQVPTHSQLTFGEMFLADTLLGSGSSCTDIDEVSTGGYKSVDSVFVFAMTAGKSFLLHVTNPHLKEIAIYDSTGQGLWVFDSCSADHIDGQPYNCDNSSFAIMKNDCLMDVDTNELELQFYPVRDQFFFIRISKTGTDTSTIQYQRSCGSVGTAPLWDVNADYPTDQTLPDSTWTDVVYGVNYDGMSHDTVVMKYSLSNNAKILNAYSEGHQCWMITPTVFADSGGYVEFKLIPPANLPPAQNRKFYINIQARDTGVVERSYFIAGGGATDTAFSPLYQTFVHPMGVPLPLILISFTGHMTKGKAILDWEVNEKNVDKYFIQHSIDGQNWEDVGRLKAKSSQGMHNYSFTTSTLVSGKHFFRLLEKDVDGKTYYLSSTVTLNNTEEQVVTTYPNPVTDMVYVKGSCEASEYAINDYIGHKVQYGTIKNNEGISVRNLPSGLYYLRISGYAIKVYKQ